jgi:hypothetical protein
LFLCLFPVRSKTLLLQSGRLSVLFALNETANSRVLRSRSSKIAICLLQLLSVSPPLSTQVVNGESFAVSGREAAEMETVGNGGRG